MRFLKDLFSDISGRSVVTLMLLCVLSLSVSAISYANTRTQILPAAKTSPTNYSKNVNVLSKTDGQQPVLFRRSSELPDQFTSFSDLKTQHLLVTNHRSNLNSAELIQSQLSSLENSTTFTSANLRITPVNRSEIFSKNNTLPTELPSLAESRVMNWKNFARLPVNALRTLLTGKQKRSFKLPFRESAIGRTLEVFHKRE